MRTPQPILIESGTQYEATGLVHRVWQPDSDGPHPTIVMNHGRSGSEDVMWIFSRTLPKEWLLVAPRAIHEDPRGGNSWELHSEARWANHVDFDESVEKLDQFIGSLADVYNADLSQLYLMGFSQGGALNSAYAMRNKRPIQGIVSLVSFMPEDAAPELSHSLVDMPILQMVGRKDDTIPLDIGRKCGQQLIQYGARLDYREYDTGHKLNSRGLKDLAAWWQAISKQ